MDKITIENNITQSTKKIANLEKRILEIQSCIEQEKEYIRNDYRLLKELSK